MGTEKSLTLLDIAEEASCFLKALANQNRLMILSLLLKREHTVGELAELLPISQPGVSQHLARMRQEDVVTARRKGTQIYYSIQHPHVKELLLALQQRYTQAEQIPDDCESER